MYENYTLGMADTKKKGGKLPAKAAVSRGRKTAAKAAATVKKAAPAAGRAVAGREALAGELRSLIPRLDAEGLSFLIEQTRVHLYNMQVKELDKTLAGTESGKAAKPVKRGDSFRLEGSGSGSSYYIVYNNDWIMFSRDEMTQLVRIISAPGTDLEIRERFYRWLERERRDVLVSIPMADKFDEKLKALTALIKRTFKIE
ncbi:MAG: hypothetical protein LBQ14_02145 [Treponema sp.]|jgi:hypothetical protein|nr:hypothetical protein [Treponema sp.]